MIPVIVAASSPVARAGLRAIVEELSDFAVADVVSPSALGRHAAAREPAVILWQLSADEDAAATLAALEGAQVVVLAPHPSLDLVRAGALGVLPVDVSPEQIEAGLKAAVLDLVVLAPEAMRLPGATPVTPVSVAPLTARETEVLRMIAEGMANKEIAYRLGISEHTVKFHVSSLLGKLGAASRAEAIAIGIRQGVILL